MTLRNSEETEVRGCWWRIVSWKEHGGEHEAAKGTSSKQVLYHVAAEDGGDTEAWGIYPGS